MRARRTREMPSGVAPPMTTAYPALFKPLTIGHLRLKNRIMSTSHAPAYAEDGLPKERYRLYHEEKARGGLALLDVRRLLDGLDRLAASVRADRSRRGPRHPVAAGVRRRRPPPRLRDDDPDHPHGAAHGMELARLAPDHRAVRGTRARAPFVSEGHGPGRHRAGHRRLRGRRRPRAARRTGRLPALGARAPRRTVLVSRGEPPHRRLRGEPRQPRPVHHGDAGGDARARTRSFPARHALHHGRARGGRAARGRRHGDRAAARRCRTSSSRAAVRSARWWWSGPDRPVWKRRGSARRAVTMSCSSRPRPSRAGRSGSRRERRGGATSSASCDGSPAKWRPLVSICVSASTRRPRTSCARVPTS